MSCNCGFGGGGGGGGSGNLSGTLTAPFFPRAAGANTLVDSQLREETGGSPGLFYSVDGNESWNFISSTGGGVAFKWQTSRGTLDVPLALVDNDRIFNLDGYAYDGAGFRLAGYAKLVSDGAPVSGVGAPGRWEYYTYDEDGNETLGWTLDKDGVFAVKEQIVIEKTSRRGLHALVIAAGSVAVDAALSDVFTLTVTEACTIAAPTNPEDGRAFMLRLKFDGMGAWAVSFVSDYHFPNDTAPTLDTTGDSFTYLGVFRNEDGDGWDVVGSPVGPFLYGA